MPSHSRNEVAVLPAPGGKDAITYPLATRLIGKASEENLPNAPDGAGMGMEARCKILKSITHVPDIVSAI